MIMHAGLDLGVVVHPSSPGEGRRGSALADPDAPARRLVDHGPSALSDRELISLLLNPGRGREKAFSAASALNARYMNGEGEVRLRAVAAADVAEIARVAVIGKVAAARLLAAFELGRRAAQEYHDDRDRLATARDIYELMRLRMRDLQHEEFRVLLLNTRCELMREVTVSRGLLDEALVHPREVFRLAVQEGASSVVLVHNHPSGEPTPSPEDKQVTGMLVTASHVVGIPVLDHVIIGEGRYYSFGEAGQIPEPPSVSFASRNGRRPTLSG
jgi:DNA repair protein RadC